MFVFLISYLYMTSAIIPATVFNWITYVIQLKIICDDYFIDIFVTLYVNAEEGSVKGIFDIELNLHCEVSRLVPTLSH